MPHIYHNSYATAEEALQNSKHSLEFPGNAICVYNLERDQYILNERLAERFERNTLKLIKQYKGA
jgi:hypothetical protein